MISINYRDPRPIYEQVRDSFRRLIISGAMPPDTKMPSVRELAASLTINPNTIQRAYKELEAEGYIYSVAAKGSFVSGISEALKKRREELLADYSQLVKELVMCGATEEELIAHLKEAENKKKKKKACKDLRRFQSARRP